MSSDHGWLRAAAAALLLAWGVGGSAVRASGQVPKQPDTSVGAALGSLASRAGVVFVGRVTAIVRVGGLVEVHFTVEQAVQGAAGTAYTLREWAGLWPPGQFRYIPGQHVLIFLNAPGKAGLTTPVDGMEGVLPVMVQGASSPELVDVRRLETRVQRRVGAALDSVDSGAMLLSDATAAITGWHSPLATEPIRRPVPLTYRPPAAKTFGNGTPITVELPAPEPVNTVSGGGVEPVALLPAYSASANAAGAATAATRKAVSTAVGAPQILPRQAEERPW